MRAASEINSGAVWKPPPERKSRPCLEAPVVAGAFALLSLPGMLCQSGSLVLLCYLVCFLIFTLVAVNSRVSKLAEGVKRRHKPQRPEQSAVAME